MSVCVAAGGMFERMKELEKRKNMYSEKVMDHFQNPRNVGEIENPSGVGTVGNAKCGDIMRMFLDIEMGKKLRKSR